MEVERPHKTSLASVGTSGFSYRDWKGVLYPEVTDGGFADNLVPPCRKSDSQMSFRLKKTVFVSRHLFGPF